MNESPELKTLEEKLRLSENRVELLDHICSDLASEQEDIKLKLDSFYSFFDKSGILYYKQLIESLIDTMDRNGMVNKEVLKKQLFKQIH
jgi:hypothetical protein